MPSSHSREPMGIRMTARRGAKKTNPQSLAPALSPAAPAENAMDAAFPIVGRDRRIGIGSILRVPCTIHALFFVMPV